MKPLFDYLMKEQGTIFSLDSMNELIGVVEKVIGHAALQAKCDRYEVALKDLKEYTSSCAEDAGYVDHDEIIDRINKALSAGEGNKEVSNA
jgi:hypothetical protein